MGVNHVLTAEQQAIIQAEDQQPSTEEPEEEPEPEQFVKPPKEHKFTAKYKDDAAKPKEHHQPKTIDALEDHIKLYEHYINEGLDPRTISMRLHSKGVSGDNWKAVKEEVLKKWEFDYTTREWSML